MKKLTLKNILYYEAILLSFTIPISSGISIVLLLLLFISWLFSIKIKKLLDFIKTNKIVLIFPTIFLLILLSLLYSNSTNENFFTIHNKGIIKLIFAHYLLIPLTFLILTNIFTKEELKQILKAFIFAVLISEIYSYLIYFNIIDISTLKKAHLIYKDASHSNPTPFTNHITYSIFLSIAVVFLIDSFLNNKSQKIIFKIVEIFFITSITTNLFINGGRTGQLSYIFAILVYFISRYKFKIKTLLTTILGLIIVLSIAYNFSNIFQLRAKYAYNDIYNSYSKNNYHGSIGKRIAADKVALNYLTSNPKNFILGAGIGDTKQKFIYSSKKINLYSSTKDIKHLHNQFLHYWYASGFLPFILFIIFLFLLIYNIDQKNKPFVFSIISIFIISSISDIVLYRYQTGILFFIFFAYIYLLKK
jgi:O-antigen ligase